MPKGYDVCLADIIRDIVQEKLPVLRVQVRAIIEARRAASGRTSSPRGRGSRKSRVR
jgi:hypothetical protein